MGFSANILLSFCLVLCVGIHHANAGHAYRYYGFFENGQLMGPLSAPQVGSFQAFGPYSVNYGAGSGSGYPCSDLDRNNSQWTFAYLQNKLSNGYTLDQSGKFTNCMEERGFMGFSSILRCVQAPKEDIIFDTVKRGDQQAFQELYCCLCYYENPNLPITSINRNQKVEKCGDKSLPSTAAKTQPQLSPVQKSMLAKELERKQQQAAAQQALAQRQAAAQQTLAQRQAAAQAEAQKKAAAQAAAQKKPAAPPAAAKPGK